jgi:hypothetical protein
MGKISDEEMQRLNYAVDGQHRDAKEVVREFLPRRLGADGRSRGMGAGPAGISAMDLPTSLAA